MIRIEGDELEIMARREMDRLKVLRPSFHPEDWHTFLYFLYEQVEQELEER